MLLDKEGNVFNRVEFLKELNYTAKAVFELMENEPKCRNNKYNLLWRYWMSNVRVGMRSMEQDILDGRLNIEGVFGSQRKIWGEIPSWKADVPSRSEMSDGYKQFFRENNLKQTSLF